jgi:hypothetical protein
MPMVTAVPVKLLRCKGIAASAGLLALNDGDGESAGGDGVSTTDGSAPGDSAGAAGVVRTGWAAVVAGAGGAGAAGGATDGKVRDPKAQPSTDPGCGL